MPYHYSHKMQHGLLNAIIGYFSHGTGRSTRQGVWLSEKLVKRFLNGGNACKGEIGKRNDKCTIIMR